MAPINIDGSPVQDITIDGQPVTEVTVDGDVVFPAIPDSVVDNFEDGDITISLKDNWSGWNGDTGSFQAQQSTVLADESSGQLDASSGTVSSVIADRDTAGTPTESKSLFRANSRNGDSVDSFRFRINNSGTKVFEIQLKSDGGFRVNNNQSISGSWSTSKTYLVRIYNIDFNNDQADWEVIDQSDGSTIASGTDFPFANSVSGADQIDLLIDSRNSADQSAFYDNIEWVQ